MDAIKIVALLKAAEYGSLTKASEELGYTQAGLTHMMNRLEKEIGLKLLQRTKSGVKLTDEAHALLPLLKKFSEADSELTNAINAIINNDSKTIRIGAYPSIANRYLPEIIRDFKSGNSNVNIDIFIGNHTELESKFANGELDIIFVSDGKDFDNRISLMSDRFCAVFSKKSECDFSNSALLLSTCENETEIKNVMKSNSISPSSETRINSSETIISMVSARLGFSILPESAITDRSGIITKPLKKDIQREISVVTKSQKLLTHAESDFLKCVKKYF